MPATVIVGLQWGDEGKGKTTDFLAEQVAMVVRYQGGDNAGHTVVSGDEVFKLHLVPSGVLYPHITSVIGSGVVVNPATLIGELDDARRARDRRRAGSGSAARAHVIMPYHVALDRATEARLGDGKVGTTGRGIGPAYARSRLADRPADGGPPRPAALCRAARARPARQEPRCSRRIDGEPRFDRRRRSSTRPLAWGERLAPHLDDTTWLVQDALARGEHVLLEGAQGTLLDLDHGSYPFVTSSNPVAGGACTGGGHRAAPGRRGHRRHEGLLDPRRAPGPFPTELTDEIGAGIAARGHEVGTTTGRPRRVGWFDAVPLRYAVAVNSRQLDHAQQARHPVRASTRSGCASPTRSTAGGSTRWPSSARPSSPRRRRSTRSSRAGRSRSTTSARWPTCPRTPAAT